MRKQLIVKFGADYYTLPSYTDIDEAMYILERMTPVEYVYSHQRDEVPSEFQYKEVEKKDYKKVDFELAHVWPVELPKAEVQEFDPPEILADANDVAEAMEEAVAEALK